MRPAGSAHPIWAGQSADRTVCRDRSWAVAIRTRSGVRSGAAGVRPAFRGPATTARVGRSASWVPDAAAWTVGSRGQCGAAAVRLVPVQGSGRTGRFMGRRGQRLFYDEGVAQTLMWLTALSDLRCIIGDIQARENRT